MPALGPIVQNKYREVVVGLTAVYGRGSGIISRLALATGRGNVDLTSADPGFVEKRP